LFGAKIIRVDAKNLYHFYFKAYQKAEKIIQDVDIIHSNTFFSAFV
jgi:hypothetical protein